MIYNNKYITKPFIVAIYYGHSKPNLAKDYLEDLVSELNILITIGINIKNRHYNFKCIAFCCDTPARAYIKLCKGHTGFFCCERCTVEGKSVIVSRSRVQKKITKKRVFDDINSEERSMESFKLQKQPPHHVGNETSPLLEIKDFDIVKNVLLDSMHLLYLGVCKYIFEKLYNNLDHIKKTTLQQRLDNVSKEIPSEFQRNIFDLSDITNWKATHRFILLYDFGFIFNFLLKSDVHDHLMILFACCRILMSTELAVSNSAYCKSKLREFVSQMPYYYGEDSVSINIHNLIHISDDVQTMKGPLSDYSAFIFENCIGFLKKLVQRSPKDPIAQIDKRISQLKNPASDFASKHYPLVHKIQKKTLKPICTLQDDNENVFSEIKLSDMTITSNSPDNVVKMKHGYFCKIEQIFLCLESHEIKIKGQKFDVKKDLFINPMPSREIGIANVKKLSSSLYEYYVRDIDKKCILTLSDDELIVITLLH